MGEAGDDGRRKLLDVTDAAGAVSDAAGTVSDAAGTVTDAVTGAVSGDGMMTDMNATDMNATDMNATMNGTEMANDTIGGEAGDDSVAGDDAGAVDDDGGAGDDSGEGDDGRRKLLAGHEGHSDADDMMKMAGDAMMNATMNATMMNGTEMANDTIEGEASEGKEAGDAV